MSPQSRKRSLAAALAGALVLAVFGHAAQAYSGSIVLFDGSNGTGASKQFEGDVADLASVGFNDRASSVFVAAGSWELCNDANFKAACGTFGPGLHNLGQLSNKVSSLRPASGSSGGGSNASIRSGFVGFKDYNGRGSVLQFEGDIGDMSSVSGFNDTLSSIAIFRGRWEVCEHIFFKGYCVTLGPGVYNLERLNDRISSIRPVGN